MRIAVGFDHAGLPLRPVVLETLQRLGHEVKDCGASAFDPLDDYPDFARAVAEAVASGECARGILGCGSGVGASVAASKVPGARAALCQDPFSARQGVEDDDMNILCLGARVTGPSLAEVLIQIYLAARYSGAERHARRLGKVRRIEEDARAGVFETTQGRKP
ncbi:MAG TPA: RpiB/LacA/LacB family sugar-phosphate isomerase [Thermoanaerobaculia bacterium]